MAKLLHEGTDLKVILSLQFNPSCTNYLFRMILYQILFFPFYKFLDNSIK